VGSNAFIETLQRDLGVSFDEAELLISGQSEMEDSDKCREIISDACEELSMGIERSLSFLRTAGDAEQLDEAVLSGGGARIPWLREILSEKHNMELVINDPLSNVERDEGLTEAEELDRISPLLSVSLGLALRREGSE
jgi:type IV pilus assembly protein PilM